MYRLFNQTMYVKVIYARVLPRLMSFPYRFVCVNVKISLYLKQDFTVWRLGVSSAPEKPRLVPIGLQTNKSVNQENNTALLIIATLGICKCGSRYPSVDMATDFAKEQYVGVYKSFYDFTSRYYGIDNILAGSGVSPATFNYSTRVSLL